MEEKKSIFAATQFGKIPILMIIAILGVVLLGGFLLFRNRTSTDEQVAEVAQKATSQIQDSVPESSSDLISPSVSPEPAEDSYEGEYSSSVVSQSEDTSLNLKLYGANTAILTEYDNNTDKIATQTGTWSTDAQGYLIVTLTEKDGNAHVSPDVLTFRKNDSQLVAVTYEADLWGRNGLIFEKN